MHFEESKPAEVQDLQSGRFSGGRGLEGGWGAIKYKNPANPIWKVEDKPPSANHDPANPISNEEENKNKKTPRVIYNVSIKKCVVCKNDKTYIKMCTVRDS